MMELDDAPSYAERADMHEQLATATSDEPARKMHQAMAAAYRRKAAETDGRLIEMAVVPHDEAPMLLVQNHG